MEPPGVTFLRPLWSLITKDWGLGLKEGEVDINYTKYINNFKCALTSNEESVEQAVAKGLTPGSSLKNRIKFFYGNLVASVNFTGANGQAEPHAMVLDTIVNDEFVFKNTYRRLDNYRGSGDSQYQVKVPVASHEAPEEFFFVHIKATQAANETIKRVEHKMYLAVTLTSMLRATCKLLIRQCHECGIINEERKKHCLKYAREMFHIDHRQSVMKIILPPSVLKDAVSRVSNCIELLY